MRTLQGRWYYQSFAALVADADRSKTPPEVKRPPLIAAPWTPRAVMELATDAAGVVTGTAKLRDVEFKIKGAIKPATGPFPDGIQLPEGVELTVVVERFAATYSLRGYFLEDSDHVVGTVAGLGNDLGLQPAGTSGPFVLYPVRS